MVSHFGRRSPPDRSVPLIPGAPSDSTAYTMRMVAVDAFLLSSAGLIFLSITIPGYVRPAWQAAFIGLGVVCVSIVAIIVWQRQLSITQVLGICLFGDVALVLAWLSLSDRLGGQVVAALLGLPTLFVGLFMRPRWLAAQAGGVMACAWVITSAASASVNVHAIRTLILVVAAICPAAVALALRRGLDRALAQSDHLATTDALTGLANRRGMDERFPALVSRARAGGMPVGVIVADVDHFKRVNDEHGHAVGDHVLQVISRVAQAAVRREDVVARLGGEELAVVAALGVEDLNLLAERVRREVEAAGKPWQVTISLGVTWGPAGTAGGTELLWSLVDSADDLMYRAKRDGRNQIRTSA